jgi:hypothetical protein
MTPTRDFMPAIEREPPNGPCSTEVATRPSKAHHDTRGFPFVRVALAMHDENRRNRGCGRRTDCQNVPVPGDKGNSRLDESQLCSCENTFFGNEIEPIRWYRSYSAVGSIRGPRLIRRASSSGMASNWMGGSGSAMADPFRARRAGKKKCPRRHGPGHG